MQTVAALFERPEATEQAHARLLRLAFSRADIGLLIHESKPRQRGADAAPHHEAESAISHRSELWPGALDLESMVVQGLGPVLASGIIATALTARRQGATVHLGTAGLTGILADLGLPEGEARAYAACVRRGDHLLALRADEFRLMQALHVLVLSGAHDPDVHVLLAHVDEWQMLDDLGFMAEPPDFAE